MDYNSLYKSLLLKQFEPLLHKTLHKLNIFQDHFHYEDYLQELRLKLIEIEKAFDGKALKEDRIRFTAYAGKGLYWFLINLLRIENKEQQVLVEDISVFPASDVLLSPLFESSHVVSNFLENVRQRLSGQELTLFYLLADDSFTMQEIAAGYGVSRKTIYDWKTKLVAKIADVKHLLYS